MGVLKDTRKAASRVAMTVVRWVAWLAAHWVEMKVASRVAHWAETRAARRV